ncbi:hypothetical protein Hanom_Chr14g01277121 [Helianthus anomalus]
MGNLSGRHFSRPEVNVQEREINGVYSAPSDAFNSEREKVGQEQQDLDNDDTNDFHLDSHRPSYITVRPKPKSKVILIQSPQPNPNLIPDLNVSADNSMGSDPFSLEDIFRREE